MPNIIIDVAAEFSGKKSLDQAVKSTNQLEKSVNKLGKRLVSVYAAKKVINFLENAGKAFLEDEAAAKRLTVAVNNLGLGFQDLAVRDFIASLQTSSAVLDDKLRPAMQAIISTTGSFAKSQELLKLALDISAGSGQDLETVANDLAQAYVGNTKGLKKYYLGLTQAELKASSFADIQKELNSQFSGANAAYLTTYAGKMALLNTAAADAKETIGKGLVDALEILGGSGGIQTIVNGMKTLATLASKFMQNMAIGFRYIKAGLTFNISEIKELNKLVAKLERGPQQYGGAYADKYKAEVSAAAAAAEKSAAAKIKADKAAAAAKAKSEKLAAAAKVKADKLAAENAAKLAKAGAMFDLDKIQIEAALKGKISDEEKLRLELQRAILNEDAALAEKLQKQLEASQRATAALQGQINGIKPLADPFAAWLTTLEGIAETLAKIAKMPGSSVGGTKNIPKDPDVVILTPDDPKKPGTNNQEPVPVIVEPDPTPPPSTNNPFAGLGGGTNGFGFSVPQYVKDQLPQAPVTVIVNNNGATIMPDELVKTISEAVITANSNGYNTYKPGALDPAYL